MTEERTVNMINETLKSGQCITKTKGQDQELIVALMNLKGNLRNVFLFHTNLVVDRTKIKFDKVLRTTQFIQKVINDRNGKFFFDCDFGEGTKIKTREPSAFFLVYHDYERRIRDGTRTHNTRF